MKANAPEKIYLQQYDENTLICLNKWNVSEEWSNKPCNEKVATNIEYIQTNAFIEKASWWIEKNIKKWYENIKVHGFSGMTPLMIEDFRKYMEGE